MDIICRFYFDAEHIGLGDVIQPGAKAQSVFNTVGNIFLMYTFGGNAEVSTLPAGEFATQKVAGTKLEIGVAVSQDGVHWSRVEG